MEEEINYTQLRQFSPLLCGVPPETQNECFDRMLAEGYKIGLEDNETQILPAMAEASRWAMEAHGGHHRAVLGATCPPDVTLDQVALLFGVLQKYTPWNLKLVTAKGADWVVDLDAPGSFEEFGRYL